MAGKGRDRAEMRIPFDAVPSAIHGGCRALLNDQTEPCIADAAQRGDAEAAVALKRSIERLLSDALFHVLQPVFCLRRELSWLRGKTFAYIA